MTASDVVEGEAVVMGQDLVIHEAQVNLFRTEDPNEVVAKATKTANALAEVVHSKKLASTISGREHVRVEGWTLLGTMLGVFPVCVWTRKLEDGWEARVEARTLTGAVVGAAEAECLRSENIWKNRDDYALRSMAQTRATSKALRQPLGFVMTLAGFDATPAEEMPREGPKQTKAQREQLAKLVKKLETEVPKAEGQKSYWEDVATYCRTQFATGKSENLSRNEMDTVIELVKGWIKEEALPFG